MNDGQSARTQIVERIKSSANILVTVSTNPSVDELSSALGLTIMLNGMKKHATAVVSGDIPPAISFLDPSKTFENTVDSLRDFIIALDKEKADHLRYKVDGDVVKIFITPYRTTISGEDLEFSQGDYNVELVLALGVRDKEHLDEALSAHGRILHDATVATLSCGEQASELGSIDWFDPNASSIAEMLVALSEALKTDAAVLDEQSATALLTGIVAATDRFSNNRTSSRVMTMAAQLMAAGANQQLISAKLEEAHEIGDSKKSDDESNDDSNNSDDDGTTELSEGESTKVERQNNKKAKKPKADDGSLAISHEKEGNTDEVAAQTEAEDHASATVEAEDALAEQLTQVAPAAATPTATDIQQDLAAASADVEEAAAEVAPQVEEAVLPPVQVQETEQQDEPALGGTLNATAEQAHEEAEAERARDRNKTILTHDTGAYVGDSQPTFQSPFNATDAKTEEPKSVDIFKDEAPLADLDRSSGQSKASIQPPETLADIDKRARDDDHADAQAAVAAAFDSAPFNPANQPREVSGAQQLGEISHEPSLPPLPPLEPPVQSPLSAPVLAGPIDMSILPPPPPPLPAFDQPAGPLPPEQLGQILTPAPEQPQQPQSNDPNQFKIPGQ